MAGRSELLGWINSTLDLRIGKVEETASGAVACQMMDALHPGIVPMKKVDFNAKNEYEYIANYKVLQEVFTRLNIDKHVEVSKLVKGRPLDNMEFMQWLKGYHDQQTGARGVHDYDAAGRRALCKTGDVRGGAAGAASAPASRAATGAGAPPLPSAAGRLPPMSGERASVGVAAVKRAPVAKVSAPGAGAVGSGRSSGSIAGRSRGPSDDGVVEQLQAEAATWRAAADTATKEKDFYWSKLRAIELLCNTCPGVPVLRVVEDILYAPSQEEGERILGEAMAELEARGMAAGEEGAVPAAAAADGGAAPPEPAADAAAPAAAEYAAAAPGGADAAAGEQQEAEAAAADGGCGGMPVAAEVLGCA